MREAGADIVLGNTYHLMLRPGAERIAALGGLQALHRLERADADRFRRLPGDVAVASCARSSEKAVTFRSHIDGAKIELSPERSIEVQRLLGSDIAMQMDECVRLPAEPRRYRARDAAVAALGRAQQARVRDRADGTMLFGIVQGGDVPELRQRERAGPGRDRLSRLRDRRACGRRTAGGDAGDDRGSRADAA